MSSILLIVLTLAQIVQEHNEVNPEELEKMKKMLDAKKVGLAKQSLEVNQLMKKRLKPKLNYKLLMSYSFKRTKKWRLRNKNGSLRRLRLRRT